MKRRELVEGLRSDEGRLGLLRIRSGTQITRRGGFHENARCGCCGGPLDDHRDGICEKCCPTSEYFDLAAQAQRISDLARRACHG